jgi:hypothetical protein
MIAALVVSITLQAGFGLNPDDPVQFAWIMLITVSVTTAAWLAVTFLTAPEDQNTLVAFYRRTRPAVAGWKPIAALAPDVQPSRDTKWNLIDWVAGCVLIYGVLFGTGKLLLGDIGAGLLMMAVALAAGALIYWDLSRRGWGSVF